MHESKQLDDAIQLASQLFGFHSFRRVDPLNVRLGKYWLGMVMPLKAPQWNLWEVGRGPVEDPQQGTLLDEFDTADQAMTLLVSHYAADCYEHFVKSDRYVFPIARP